MCSNIWWEDCHPSSQVSGTDGEPSCPKSWILLSQTLCSVPTKVELSHSDSMLQAIRSFSILLSNIGSGHRPWLHRRWFVVESPSIYNTCSNVANANITWRRMHPLRIRHQRQHAHSITQHWWRLSALIASSVEKIGTSLPPHCITHYGLPGWPRLDVLAFWEATKWRHWLSASPGKRGWTRVGILRQALVFRVDCYQCC